MAKKYTHIHMFPPCFVRSSVDGQLYMVPNWIPVEDGTTRDDVEWIKPDFGKWEFVKRVKSSRGDTTYTIEKKGDEYQCSCPGAKYRNRMCKHIKQLLQVAI